MSGRKILTIIIILALLVIGIISAINSSNNKEVTLPSVDWEESDEEKDRDNQENINDIFRNWRRYNSVETGISLKIPKEASTFIEREKLKVRFFGSESEPNTEIIDGWTFYVDTKELKGKSLEETARAVFKDKEEKYKIAEELKQYQTAGKNAYSFSFESALGNTVNALFLPTEGSEIFSITYSITADEEEKNEYKNMIERMTETLELTSDKNE